MIFRDISSYFIQKIQRIVVESSISYSRSCKSLVYSQINNHQVHAAYLCIWFLNTYLGVVMKTNPL